MIAAMCFASSLWAEITVNMGLSTLSQRQAKSLKAMNELQNLKESAVEF